MVFSLAVSERDVTIKPGLYAMMDSQGDSAGVDTPCCWDSDECQLAQQHIGHDVG